MGNEPRAAARDEERLSMAVAAKVTPELYDYIHYQANKNAVTMSSWVRELLMRTLVEDDGNHEGNDSSDDGER